MEKQTIKGALKSIQKLGLEGGKMVNSKKNAMSKLLETIDLTSDLFSKKLVKSDAYYYFFGDANFRDGFNELLQKVFNTKEIFVYYDDSLFAYDKNEFFNQTRLFDFLEDHENNVMEPFLIMTESIHEFVYMNNIFEDIFLISVDSIAAADKIMGLGKDNDNFWVGKITDTAIQERFSAGLYITKKKLKKLIELYST
ncbi:hypothetical protein [Enterococcus sp.]|uniref:hypothetical protein n=1 Tax=Enterococcus sp. TaxID=35783 RepID=UPI003C723E55